MSNSGIQINGGTINAKQIVAGTGATVVLQESNDQSAILLAIDRLEEAISASNIATNDLKKMTEAVTAAKDELARSKPDKSAVERALHFIEYSAGSIATIGTAVKTVLSLLA